MSHAHQEDSIYIMLLYYFFLMVESLGINRQQQNGCNRLYIAPDMSDMSYI